MCEESYSVMWVYAGNIPIGGLDNSLVPRVLFLGEPQFDNEKIMKTIIEEIREKPDCPKSEFLDYLQHISDLVVNVENVVMRVAFMKNPRQFGQGYWQRKA
jgi:hypothetical protein